MFLISHCYARSTLEHYVRVRAKGRGAPGVSLGRSFSRSCGGLTAPLQINKDQTIVDSRKASIKVSTKIPYWLFQMLLSYKANKNIVEQTIYKKKEVK